MYIPSMTPSHPARRASIGLITKFQCGSRGVRGARGAVFRDTRSGQHLSVLCSISSLFYSRVAEGYLYCVDPRDNCDFLHIFVCAIVLFLVVLLLIISNVGVRTVDC